MCYRHVVLTNLGSLLGKNFFKMYKISFINESCFSCQNIGQISILVILVVSKCSIYDVKNPISPIFRGPQTPHIATIFEKILQTIIFYVNKNASYILVTICEPSRIPTAYACWNRNVDWKLRKFLFSHLKTTQP